MPKEKSLRLLFLAGCITAMALLAWYIGRPMLRFVSEPERFQNWIQGKGVWGILVFVLMSFLQVFAAIIPGGPFSAAAGYAFGPFWGTVICVVSTSVAAVLLVLLVRRFGPRVLRLFTDKSPEDLPLFRDTKRLEWLLLLIFLIPGTPKDVITYAVGLSKISLWSWFAINLIGRIPGIALSALGGSSLSRGDYGLVIGVTAVLAVLYLVGLLVYRRHVQKQG